jgi:hypothetical protein
MSKRAASSVVPETKKRRVVPPQPVSKSQVSQVPQVSQVSQVSQVPQVSISQKTVEKLLSQNNKILLKLDALMKIQKGVEGRLGLIEQSLQDSGCNTNNNNNEDLVKVLFKFIIIIIIIIYTNTFI